MDEQNQQIQSGDIRFDLYSQIHFYITNSSDNSYSIINSKMYTSSVNKNECYETRLIKHFDDNKEGLIKFVESFCE